MHISSARPYLLDVSRLIWRLWKRRLPTGIDRVCLEYVDHFACRSQAVIQFRGHILVLAPRDSDKLFALLRSCQRGWRTRLAMQALRTFPSASRRAPRPGMIYLNVGHTGLHDRGLPGWIAANRCEAIYLVHDLIPITHPQFCRPGEAEKHCVRMKNALASATGIIGNSRATLDELCTFATRHAIPMAPSMAAWISGHQHTAPVRPRRLERPYFLTLGTIEGRKNHILLLQLWQRLIASMGPDTPILLIVGQRGWQAEAATEILGRVADPAGIVRELGHCDDLELQELLAGAEALLMPSFAEGFGLPVIEALQAGTPVIASDLPVYREIVGDIPTYLEPLDLHGWESAIREFLSSSNERSRQKLAMKRFRPPDWAQHFAAVEDWLDELIHCEQSCKPK